MLATLQASKHEKIGNAEISVLVRGKDKADAMRAKGVTPILFDSFDDDEAIRQAASEHDRMVS